MIAAKTLAKKIAARLYGKLGFDIELLDVRKVCNISNYFLICSAKNRYHIAALSDMALEVLDEKHAPVFGVEGMVESGWVVVDVGSLIIHLFLPEVREYYDLSHLWSDAKLVELNFQDIPKPVRQIRKKSKKIIKR